jgi:transcriptional regulator with XRE-family HTH domain
VPDKRFSPTKLRSLRRRAGMSATGLAWACGRSEQQVYAWEQGRHLPAPEVLDLIAAALGVAREDLFEEDGARARA